MMFGPVDRSFNAFESLCWKFMPRGCMQQRCRPVGGLCGTASLSGFYASRVHDTSTRCRMLHSCDTSTRCRMLQHTVVCPCEVLRSFHLYLCTDCPALYASTVKKCAAV
jgi:hypothetical protein